MRLHPCPRCQWESFEKLRTHSYCINCNYYEVKSVKLPRHSPLPPPPKAPSMAKEIEMTLYENDELITPLVHENKPFKKAG